MSEKVLVLNIPTFESLWESLPGDVQSTLDSEERERLRHTYERELALLLQFASRAAQPQVVLTTFRQSGRQSIAEFWANDLGLPRTDRCNWHLQNTSQWVYAGAILVEGGRVSAHH